MVLTEKQVTTTTFSLCPSNWKRKTGVVVGGGGVCLCLCVCVSVLVCKRTGIIFLFAFLSRLETLCYLGLKRSVAKQWSMLRLVWHSVHMLTTFYPAPSFSCIYRYVEKKREREKEETERFTTAHTHLYSFFSLKVVLVKYRERLSAWSNIKRKGKKRWGGAPVILLVTSVV